MVLEDCDVVADLDVGVVQIVIDSAQVDLLIQGLDFTLPFDVHLPFV